MLNTLITTLGTTWSIIPELIGFTNINNCHIFDNHPNRQELLQYAKENNVENVKNVWIITTDSNITTKSIENIKRWNKQLDNRFNLKVFISQGIDDMSNIEECKSFGNLIYQVVLTAKQQFEHSKLYLSLAGGRKTMSSDMQQAAYFFGCDALLHIINTKPINADNFTKPLTKEKASNLIPIVVSGKIKQSSLLQAIPEITKNFIIDTNTEKHKTSYKLYDELYNLRKRAGSFMSNYLSTISNKSSTSNFRLFYSFEPDIINNLQNEFIAKDPSEQKNDLEWLKKLPKAELHCHLGGILTPDEMIETAQEILHDKKAEKFIDSKPCKIFKDKLTKAIEKDDLDTIKKIIDSPRRLRKFNIELPYCTALFIYQFKQNPPLLYKYIYGTSDTDTLKEKFVGRGIKYYEKLGDLQGSGLLQNETAIRTVCKILKRKTKKDNIKYLELRCSPENYTKGNLKSKEVVDIMIDELEKDRHCHYALIFIASRHGDINKVKNHIELAKNILDNKDNAFNWLVGFDLAGEETAKSPEKFRESFLPLMEKCINITIHAGEGENVENIWKAVYHLNADRIGHGLTLKDKPALINRFIDRKIAIEMCPTSNFQIVGFKDYNIKNSTNLEEYPLKEYLDRGIYVTINSDDPGVSLTNLTKEYYKAASMTKGGLSKWDILRIIRNGFRFAFISHHQRREILLEAEKQIGKIILEQEDS